MNVLARAVAITTWKHLAWATAAGLAWQIAARLGMFAATSNMFAPEVWIPDLLWGVVYAWVYLAAIVLAEANARPGLLWPYVLAALAAGLITTLMAWQTPIQWSEPTNEAERRELLAFSTGRASAGALQVAWHMSIVIFGTLATALYAWIRQTRFAEARLRDAELARAESQRRLLAARLESAQETIDPSEVLTRLAEIEQEYEADRTAADAMLDELIAFLRAAIPRVRSADHEPAAAPPAAAAT